MKLVIDSRQWSKPSAVIGNQVAEISQADAPLVGEFGERQAGRMKLIAQQFAEASAAASRMVCVLLDDQPALHFDVGLFNAKDQ